MSCVMDLRLFSDLFRNHVSLAPGPVAVSETTACTIRDLFTTLRKLELVSLPSPDLYVKLLYKSEVIFETLSDTECEVFNYDQMLLKLKES